MAQFLSIIFGIAALAMFWTLYSMKRDGYFGKSPTEKDAEKSPRKGSIIFSGGTVKHVKADEQ